MSDSGKVRRVIVCGTREGLEDTAILVARLKALGPGWIVVEGGARGVDRQARDTAFQLGIPIETYLADWDRHGRAAGPIRNGDMLAAGADLVLAYPGPHSTGTWDMVRRSEAAGVPVEIRYVD